jgi:hypothetical protein
LRWRCNRGCALGSAALLLAAAPAAGDDAPEEAPPVALEKLLDLPPGLDSPAVRYGGATRNEWRARFDEARAKKAEAQAALDKAQQELGEIAAETDQWQMSAPGLGGVQAAAGDKGPLNYRLHQEIRRQREEIARADQRLQELRVEANLAGVPREWTEPEPPAGPGTGAEARALPAASGRPE